MGVVSGCFTTLKMQLSSVIDWLPVRWKSQFACVISPVTSTVWPRPSGPPAIFSSQGRSLHADPRGLVVELDLGITHYGELLGLELRRRQIPIWIVVETFFPMRCSLVQVWPIRNFSRIGHFVAHRVVVGRCDEQLAEVHGGGGILHGDGLGQRQRRVGAMGRILGPTGAQDHRALSGNPRLAIGAWLGDLAGDQEGLAGSNWGSSEASFSAITTLMSSLHPCNSKDRSAPFGQDGVGLRDGGSGLRPGGAGMFSTPRG